MVYRPIASVVWLAISVGLLLLMGKSVEICNAEPPIETRWQLLSLPYNLTKVSTLPTTATDLNRKPETTTTVGTKTAEQDNTTIPIPSRSETFRCYEYCFTIRITMRSNFGICSWRSYEVFTEALAVGIYLYATFVLTSTLFLNADQAMYLAITMSLGQSFIRILGALC